MKKTTACAVTALVVLVCVLTIGAGTYVGVPKGQIYQAYVAYSDADTIVVKPGYGECNGHYFEITSDLVYDVNYIPSGEDFIYIYIDDDQSDYPYPTICDSTTEPVWSDSKLGWYNGNDRCIGVVWTPADSATIQKFANNLNQKYIMADNYLARPLYPGYPNGSFQFLETTAYIPVNAIAVSIRAENWDYLPQNDFLGVSVRAYGVQNAWLSSYGFYTVRVTGWIELERGCTRDLEWCGFDNDNDHFAVDIDGYQIER